MIEVAIKVCHTPEARIQTRFGFYRRVNGSQGAGLSGNDRIFAMEN